jgi:hypothetical protein
VARGGAHDLEEDVVLSMTPTKSCQARLPLLKAESATSEAV